MEDMPSHREALFERLSALQIETKTVEHAPLFTVEQSQSLRGEIAGAHTKNLFLKCKKGRLWLVVALEDAAIDLKSLHKRIGSGRLSFGKPDLLLDVLGVPPGSVTPFALINDTETQVQVVLDAEMMACDPLNFHPLENTATTTIRSADLERFIRACGHEPLILALYDKESPVSQGAKET